MSNKKNFQKKANNLLALYPEQNKVIIVENGQCFFDEKSAQIYHDTKEFDSDPQIFFREGFEDEDDSDLQEALRNAEIAKVQLSDKLEQVASIADLDQDYEPANAETDDTVTSVILLREKFAAKEQELLDANVKIEALEKVAEENEDLKKELEAANHQIKALMATDNTKNVKNAPKTDSKKA